MTVLLSLEHVQISLKTVISVIKNALDTLQL